MIINLKCPIELRHYEFVYDDIGTSIVTIDLCNVGDKTITGYSADVHAEHSLNHDSADMHQDIDNVLLAGGVEFRLQLSVELTGADRLDMYFSRVVFSDGTVWNGSDDCDLVEIGQQRELTGSIRDEFTDFAGEDAINYPEMQSNYWRCVCGRINSLESSECIRCRREREYVLTELNNKIMNLTKEQEKERKKRIKRAKKARKMEQSEGSSYAYIVILIAAIVVFFILVSYIGFIKPSIGV